jgi:hypothetical protein
MTLIALSSLIGRNAAAFSASPEEISNFQELMNAKWLTCEFQQVKMVSGKILDGVGYDAEKKRVDALVVVADQAEIEAGPFQTLAVLVFDGAKSKARLIYPDLSPGSSMSWHVGSVHVNHVSALTPGEVQLAIVWKDRGEDKFSVTGNVVIFPAKTPKGNFVALANIFFDLHMFIREASCSSAISNNLRPEVEKIRAELEASNVKE